jgi:hypothetical protein
MATAIRTSIAAIQIPDFEKHFIEILFIFAPAVKIA